MCRKVFCRSTVFGFKDLEYIQSVQRYGERTVALYRNNECFYLSEQETMVPFFMKSLLEMFYGQMFRTEIRNVVNRLLYFAFKLCSGQFN